jgi:hypothetical protein
MIKKTKMRGPSKAIPTLDLTALSAPLMQKSGKPAAGGMPMGGAPMGGGQYYF